ncbi:MAG: helix-turn-helix domain-containing protein [Clostridia bacterium]|nr:helix-turn-helix domain-containing protein [Clostridia bacterium]
MNIYRADIESNFYYDNLKKITPPVVPMHLHNFYELLFFQEGDAVYKVEGNNYELSGGEILITNPRELHSPVFKSNQEYTRMMLSVKPGYLSEFLTHKYDPFAALKKRKLGTKNKIDANLVQKFELDKKMNTIGEYYNSDLPEKEVMIKSTLLQLLVNINNIVGVELSKTSSSNIDNIIYFINENLSSKITLDDLANEFYLNKYHIAHLFKEKMGMTFMQYITTKRITLSKELISKGIPLQQVSEMVGYNDYSNFYRTFVKMCGIPPNKLK